jgi:hypothetical protein
VLATVAGRVINHHMAGQACMNGICAAGFALFSTCQFPKQQLHKRGIYSLLWKTPRQSAAEIYGEQNASASPDTFNTFRILFIWRLCESTGTQMSVSHHPL